MSSEFFAAQPTAFVLDDTPSVYRLVQAVARLRGIRVEHYASADGWFQTCHPARTGCVFVDLQLPASGGMEFFDLLAKRRLRLPVVVLSACVEAPVIVKAMKAGALNYLEKPCNERRLEEALDEAIRWDAENHHEIQNQLKIQRRLGRLTSGERQVLDLLVHGMSNRQIADQLDLSVRAIEVRRSKLMGKMRAKSLAELLGQTMAGNRREAQSL